jgi:tRNA pseudouridine55 synthase
MNMAARPRPAWRTVDGIVLLDKPEGLSSNQALQRVRRLFRARKAGHTGSLDPLATGVLPLCFGQATKVAGFLLDADKTYRAVVALGVRTSTGDREGEAVERVAVPTLDRATVEAVFERFLGASEQVPPMYSALKRDGEALYSLARRGIEVERAPRPVRIEALSLRELTTDELEFEVTCSKGTYVRTLGEDLARALGSVGHLKALRRTSVGGAFAGAVPHTLAALEGLADDEAALDGLLLPVDSALHGYPQVTLGAGEVSRFRHGQTVGVAVVPATQVRLYAPDGVFLGIGASDAAGCSVRPVRLMADGDLGPDR